MLHSKEEILQKIEEFTTKSKEDRQRFPIFCNSKLPDMEIRDTVLEDAFFEHLEVNELNFFGCHFINCTFKMYSSRSFHLNYCTFEDCDFFSSGRSVSLYKCSVNGSHIDTDQELSLVDCIVQDSRIKCKVKILGSELYNCTIYGNIYDTRPRHVYQSSLEYCMFSIYYDDLGFFPPERELIEESHLTNCGFDFCYLSNCSIVDSSLTNCSVTNSLDNVISNLKLQNCKITNLVEDHTYIIDKFDCCIETETESPALSILESALKDAEVDTSSLIIGVNSISISNNVIWVPSSKDLINDDKLLESYVRIIKNIQQNLNH